MNTAQANAAVQAANATLIASPFEDYGKRSLVENFASTSANYEKYTPQVLAALRISCQNKGQQTNCAKILTPAFVNKMLQNATNTNSLYTIADSLFFKFTRNADLSKDMANSAVNTVKIAIDTPVSVQKFTAPENKEGFVSTSDINAWSSAVESAVETSAKLKGYSPSVAANIGTIAKNAFAPAYSNSGGNIATPDHLAWASVQGYFAPAPSTKAAPAPATKAAPAPATKAAPAPGPKYAPAPRSGFKNYNSKEKFFDVNSDVNAFANATSSAVEASAGLKGVYSPAIISAAATAAKTAFTSQYLSPVAGLSFAISEANAWNAAGRILNPPAPAPAPAPKATPAPAPKATPAPAPTAKATPAPSPTTGFYSQLTQAERLALYNYINVECENSGKCKNCNGAFKDKDPTDPTSNLNVALQTNSYIQFGANIAALTNTYCSQYLDYDMGYGNFLANSAIIKLKQYLIKAPAPAPAPAPAANVYKNVKYVEISGGASNLVFAQIGVFDTNGNNIALNRTTTSSGAAWGTTEASSVNGNFNQKLGFGGAAPYASYRVILDNPTSINYVIVIHRTDASSLELESGFTVKLIDQGQRIMYASAPLTSATTQKITTFDAVNDVVAPNTYANVRYVRVEGGSANLILGQIGVFDTNGNNLALKRPTLSSGTAWGTTEAASVNGNFNQRYGFAGSGPKAYYQVNLDGASTISYVVIMRRTDSNDTELGSGFIVKLLDGNSNLIYKSAPLTNSIKQVITTFNAVAPAPAPRYTPAPAPRYTPAPAPKAAVVFDYNKAISSAAINQLKASYSTLLLGSYTITNVIGIWYVNNTASSTTVTCYAHYQYGANSFYTAIFNYRPDTGFYTYQVGSGWSATATNPNIQNANTPVTQIYPVYSVPPTPKLSPAPAPPLATAIAATVASTTTSAITAVSKTIASDAVALLKTASSFFSFKF